jgi:hypothetical protein
MSLPSICSGDMYCMTVKADDTSQVSRLAGSLHED